MSAYNDAAFLRMFLIVLGALVAFTVAILLLANRITGVVDEERGEDPRLRAAVIERIRPVGSVDVAAAAPAGAGGEAAPVEASSGPVDAAKEMASDAADAAKAMASSAAATVTGAVEAVTSAAVDEPAFDLAKGKSVYDVACFACHMTGAAGAPKMGDSAVWGPRIAQGMDTLVTNAINGKNAMPPKGGRLDLSDQDVASAVAYLVEQSK